MRDTLVAGIEKLAQEDKKVLLLTGDHGGALWGNFRENFPEQYINVGIAEQNMVGVAAGLSRLGFRPFVYALSAFVPVRVLEQMKLDVCHDNLPVVFLGDGAGFVYSHLGTSHQSTEDIAVTRVIPNLSIFSPADKIEMNNSLNLAYTSKSPVYLRIGKSDVGDIHEDNLSFNLGDLINLKEGSGKIHFIATGSMVKSAIELTKEFPEAGLSSAPSLKPIDSNEIIKICNNNEVVFTLEEHSILGGLGSIVAEISSLESPVHLCRIGVNDRFSELCGTYHYLLKEHKLDIDSIKGQITKFLNNRI